MSLHDTLINGCGASVVERLIENGVDCNLSYFDRDHVRFISPIQLAATNSIHDVLYLLFEKRNQLTEQQLEKHFNLYINQYDPSKETENDMLINFIVSHLLHKIITEYEEKDFSILFAAINDIDDASQHGVEISAPLQQTMFLVLRIYTLVRLILRMRTDMTESNDNEELTLLKNELLQNLETYYLLHDISFIPISDLLVIKKYRSKQSFLKTCYTSIAKNVIKKIQELEINQEYTIPTGWLLHAVCVSFRRINQTQIHIRIDNPSSHNPPDIHDVDNLDEYTCLIKPKILGYLNLNQLQDNLKYFVSLISSIKQQLPYEIGKALIYNSSQIKHLVTRNIESIRSFREQAQLNCFVKCFEPGFQMRFGERHRQLCEKIIALDTYSATLLKRYCAKSRFSSVNKFYIQYASLDDSMSVEDATRLEEKLRECYTRSYRNLQNLAITEEGQSLIEKYIPLKFQIADQSILQLEDLFRESRILVLADFGRGKTTMCQYITYLWSCGDLWKDKFDWLFYIKLKNLNRKFYPQEIKNYSLIDIVEKECFQGVRLSYLDKQKLTIQFENSLKILWILDGLDDRQNEDYLSSIEQDLLNKPNLILTSRPSITYDFYPLTKIYLQGFSPEDIKRFIMKYFSISSENEKQIEQYSSLIRASVEFYPIASIPVCLKIMCNLWRNNRNLYEDTMTIEKLYEKMCEHLLRQYLSKFHELDTSTLTANEIFQHRYVTLTYLEYLAFETTKEYRSIVSGTRITDLAKEKYLSILRIGLLVPQLENRAYLVDDSYYFIHRSFQEYLCARYIIRILTKPPSEKDKQDVTEFIANEKYSHDLQNTFRMFFNMKPSEICRDHFWTAVDSKPRDLVGFRHCSRIIQWFSDSPASFSDEEDNISKRTTDVVIEWISNVDHPACDYGNTYIFETFFNTIPHFHWLRAWEHDLSIENPSKRRYFLDNLWSKNNLRALRNVYNEINNNYNVKKLFHLIKEGPTMSNLQRIGLDPQLFTLPSIDDSIKRSQLLIEAQEKARNHQKMTSYAEFQMLLNNYPFFARLNRQAEACNLPIYRLKIASSALVDLRKHTLKYLLKLTKENQLFYRDFALPALPFVQQYVRANGPNKKILCSLIVSIAFSNECIVAASTEEKRAIRIQENKKSVIIELSEDRWSKLIQAFDRARRYDGRCFHFSCVN